MPRKGKTKQPDTIRAHRLEIVDSQGRVRMVLGIDPWGEPNEDVVLTMTDERERERVSLKIETSDDGSALTALELSGLGQDDPTYLSLRAGTSNTLSVAMVREGKTVLELSSKEDAMPEFNVYGLTKVALLK